MVLQSQENLIEEELTSLLRTGCRKNVPYENAFFMEGTLRITADEKDLFVININETVKLKPLGTKRKVVAKKKSLISKKRGRPRRVQAADVSDNDDTDEYGGFEAMDEDVKEEIQADTPIDQIGQDDIQVKEEPSDFTPLLESAEDTATSLQELAAKLATGSETTIKEQEEEDEEEDEMVCRTYIIYI